MWPAYLSIQGCIQENFLTTVQYTHGRSVASTTETSMWGRKSGILSQITEIDWLGHTRHFLVMVPFSSHSKPKFYNQCEA